ncbi:MAG: FtsX-like permease family protein [Chloroflexi bacterium]|nr:FtsX-like permease family protein [Chloroflexota bacterium]
MLEQLRFYLAHSINDLRVNGQRTIFALLCIAAGVAAIVSLQTLGVMIEDTLTGSLQESNRGDIRVSVAFAFEDEDDEATFGDAGADASELEQGRAEGVIASVGSFTTDYITPNGIERIRSWLTTAYPGSEVTYRQSEANLTAGLSMSAPDKDTDQTFVTPYIVDADIYPFYGEVTSEDGDTLDEMINEPTDIVISRNLADTLEVEVGDRVRLSGGREDFTIRGIVPTDAESGFENIPGALFGYYFLDLSAVSLFSEIDQGAEVVYVRLADPDAQLAGAEAALERQFPYLSITTTDDLEEQNSQISKYLNQLVIIMGLVSLLIGGIGIVNTMLVIVSRRTTEVAVLKTIGLEGEQVTALFMVEAVLMGIVGSIFGIFLGWLAAYLLKGVAGTFLAQTLSFRITPAPAIIGFVVGIVVTTIFGLMPTLAAGQVRPNLVLRPSDTVMPSAGRARSFVALLVVLAALSVVAQALVRDLLDADLLRSISQNIGLVLGLLMGLAMLGGGLLSGWTRGNIILRILRWGLLLVGLPIAGALFGRLIPALLILSTTFILVGLLYVMLWMLIWSVGGGSLRDLWLIKLPRDASPLRKALIALVSLPVWILNAVFLVLMLPFWALGHLIQAVAFVDLKMSLRAMLATRGRGASTLLALVVGVFTLSLITMLANAITNRIDQLLEQEAGGNVIVFAAGFGNTLDQVDTELAELQTQGHVKSYAAVGTYSAELVSVEDAATGETRTLEQLEQQIRDDEAADEFALDMFRFGLSSIDSRDIESNLPDVEFYAGRQLTPDDAGEPLIVIPANEGTLAAGIDVGDRLTFRLGGEEGAAFGVGRREATEVTFEVVGMVDRRGPQISVEIASQSYAPRGAFPEGESATAVSAIVDAEETGIGEVRRSMSDIPGVFVMETRFINDLINRVVDQFTSFPILVAALALFTGGVVIANSVALSTLERRREIGVMKAVGLQRERVLGMLLLEYGLMGLIGGLIGVGLGGVGLLLLLVQAFGGELGEAIPYGTALVLMGLCVAIALVAAILTAWSASGEKPLNVLRYE